MKAKWNLLQKLGLLLVLISFVLLLGSEVYTVLNRNRVEKLNQQILAAMPQRNAGDPMNYSDPSMPVLQLDGEDFSGILLCKAFGVTLPIGSSWNRNAIAGYPHRFWGSAYDNSLILGGSTRKGQLDFLGKLDLGDRFTVTDLQGAEFTYEVTRIDRRDNADMETLQDPESHLVVFAREESTLQYIIVRCVFTPTSI